MKEKSRSDRVLFVTALAVVVLGCAAFWTGSKTLQFSASLLAVVMLICLMQKERLQKKRNRRENLRNRKI